MSLRDECRALLSEARGIAGSAAFGLHPWRVYLRTTASSGSHAGDGTLTETEVELLENGAPPKVSKPGGERAGGSGDSPMLSADVADSDIYVVGPITPVVGTAWATLLASGVNVEETWKLRVVHSEQGGSGTLCRVVDINDQSALHVMITGVAIGPA